MAPWAVTPLLMLGGAYLCFEGFEKLAHKFMHRKQDEEAHHQELVQALADPKVNKIFVDGGAATMEPGSAAFASFLADERRRIDPLLEKRNK